MTRNLYVGGDVDLVLAAPPELVPFVVGQVYQTVLDALQARGLDYVVAATVQDFDIELPMLTPSYTLDDVRFTDFDVILARGDVRWTNPQAHTYAVKLSFPFGPFTVNVDRGWVAVDATIAGSALRFVSTHLESAVPAIQEAQAAELIAALSGVPRPTLVVGDLNSAADGSDTQSYGMMIGAGFADTWSDAHPRDAGYTCCQQADLQNTVSQLDRRIDLVLFRDRFANGNLGIVGGVHAMMLGGNPADRISGLWPSDHAGVVTTLNLPPQ